MTGIRAAREADYDALARIWWQGSGSFDGAPATPEFLDELRARLPREVAANGWHVFAAEIDGGVAGLLAIEPRDGVLTELFVDETLRSRGIGKALLDFAKREMPAGFWLRTHSRNLRGQAFYRREGLAHLRDEPHPRHPEALFAIFAWRP
ncbi:MAG TPA: GNAT family N-acetyltransferase [Rhizomicrobium sp.]|nr:GNAT family N-acetyltransferase [Rhizomicrobium sp.]